MKIDKFDLAILSVLQRDARASLQEVSAAVGLSTTPCWTRIKRMEAEGVIQGYTVRIDPAAVGFGRMLEEIPEVIEAYLISGDYDYYIRIAVRDTRDYERLLRQKLYRIPGIRHSRSSFVLRTLKQSLIPLEPSSPTENEPAADVPKGRRAKGTAVRGKVR
jgi:Lrp/AsnC family transcriptional regulator, leucine-responsive regulatory protein